MKTGPVETFIMEEPGVVEMWLIELIPLAVVLLLIPVEDGSVIREVLIIVPVETESVLLELMFPGAVVAPLEGPVILEVPIVVPIAANVVE